MLRYIERIGLLQLRRSESGYRLYGPEELQRLRTLRELLSRFEIGLTDIGFASRLRCEPELGSAVEAWFETAARRPQDVPADEWLRWEQDKHQKLIAATPPSRPMEIA